MYCLSRSLVRFRNLLANANAPPGFVFTSGVGEELFSVELLEYMLLEIVKRTSGMLNTSVSSGSFKYHSTELHHCFQMDCNLSSSFASTRSVGHSELESELSRDGGTGGVTLSLTGVWKLGTSSLEDPSTLPSSEDCQRNNVTGARKYLGSM